jgi:phospholipid-transporting ATPase
LQDGVPDAIANLAVAGIKLWVLTGDRQETAINIGYSCRLLDENMNVFIVTGDNEDEVRVCLEKRLANFQRADISGWSDTPPKDYRYLLRNPKEWKSILREWGWLKKPSKEDTKRLLDAPVSPAISNVSSDDLELSDSFALVIDGKCLGYALKPSLEKTFLKVATRCKSVICCRVSPLQKALVVGLVKKFIGALTLAIGDGANDVGMIQAAHVGVGISGHEGLQAARSADVAISQFRFLKKLLLVHGAWSYQRLSKLILYSFYKNITLYMTQVWFAAYNGYSGQTIYESWTVSLYNVIFTILPPFAIGVFDQFVSARQLELYPQLYKLGQNRQFFNVRVFWEWTINAFGHSMVSRSIDTGVIFFRCSITW